MGGYAVEIGLVTFNCRIASGWRCSVTKCGVMHTTLPRMHTLNGDTVSVECDLEVGGDLDQKQWAGPWSEGVGGTFSGWKHLIRLVEKIRVRDIFQPAGVCVCACLSHHMSHTSCESDNCVSCTVTPHHVISTHTHTNTRPLGPVQLSVAGDLQRQKYSPEQKNTHTHAAPLGDIKHIA